ncbi:MAG: serine protease [Bryobacteraceae bacterium]|nr:serine protease [Bryobacteraceae bacterium]
MLQRRLFFILFGGLLLSGISTTVVAQNDCTDNRRIVGGVNTDIKEHPWQVALNFPEVGGLCGGSLIQDRWVLTAAHCFPSSTDPKSAQVKAGATNYRQGGAWTEVEKVFVHEAYNASTYENDIALVRLKSATAGDIIPLAEPSQPLKACDKLEVTGWGRTSEGGQTADILQKGEILYIENDTCNASNAYNGAIKSGMMCAGFRDGGVDSCQGDSGGPLVLNGNDGPVLIGVVSWGEGCAKKLRYGVYTRLAKYRDWVSSTILGNQN